jgi:hypothetical protein
MCHKIEADISPAAGFHGLRLHDEVQSISPALKPQVIFCQVFAAHPISLWISIRLSPHIVAHRGASYK